LVLALQDVPEKMLRESFREMRSRGTTIGWRAAAALQPAHLLLTMHPTRGDRCWDWEFRIRKPAPCCSVERPGDLCIVFEVVSIFCSAWGSWRRARTGGEDIIAKSLSAGFQNVTRPSGLGSGVCFDSMNAAGEGSNRFDGDVAGGRGLLRKKGKISRGITSVAFQSRLSAPSTSVAMIIPSPWLVCGHRRSRRLGSTTQEVELLYLEYHEGSRRP
jgi:hypothetical protein